MVVGVVNLKSEGEREAGATAKSPDWDSRAVEFFRKSDQRRFIPYFIAVAVGRIQSSDMEEGGGLRERILARMRLSGYQPSNKGELARDLRIQADERAQLRTELAALEREGVVVRGKKARYRLREQEGNLLSGILRFQPRGSAWFYPDQQDPANMASGIDLERFRRIHVSAQKTSVALDGDRVALRIERLGPPVWWKHARHKKEALDAPGAEDQASGRVERILERRSGVIVGTLIRRKGFIYVQPDDRSLPSTIELDDCAGGESGQKVAVGLGAWDSRQVAPRGEVLEILGWPDEAGVDIRGIILRHGLREEFPGEVIREAEHVPSTVRDGALQGRVDWRQEVVITIDPADARDFDDAIWVRKAGDGWELAVHIADVAHYVRPDTAMDREARERGNSTYLVDRVLPMLPEQLSNGICSLVPGEDRLTRCAVMRVDRSGKMVLSRLERAVIRSHRRLTYEEAQGVLDAGGKEPEAVLSETEALLRECWKLAGILRKRRFSEGALDLDFPEIRMELDDLGRAVGYRRNDYNESHQLIEEFMLVANEAVARAVKNAMRPAIYRVHEDPDHDKIHEFTELARMHGYEPGDLLNKKHIQRLLDECRGHPEEHAIKLGLLKSLKRASYREEPIGHYGLSKVDYCHFTSPIRRYADLIVHRAIDSLLVNPPGEGSGGRASRAQCAEIAGQVSTSERTSASAEVESHRLKMLEWLTLSMHSADPPVFEAVITDVRKIGLMVEALEILQRGLVRRDHFPAGSWRLERHRMRYANAGGGELVLGQLIRVRVAAVNMERQQVDFHLLED